MSSGEVLPHRVIGLEQSQEERQIPEIHASPELQDECGFVAVVSLLDNAAELAVRGIIPLENRGRENTGVCIRSGGTIIPVKEWGVGRKAFPDRGVALGQKYPGYQALAFARYSTQGKRDLYAAPPFHFGIEYAGRLTDLMVAANGNLINTTELVHALGLLKGGWASDIDLMGMTFIRAILDEQTRRPNQPLDFKSIVHHTLPRFKGAFSGAVVWEEETIAFCDPNGLKPAMIGKLPDGGIMVASEVTALDDVNATFLREMEPGELVVLNRDGSWHGEQWSEGTAKGCLMDALYFMKPQGENGTKAIFRGVEVEGFRRAVGRELAQVAPVDADIIIGVPNSGILAGRGYAEASNIPYVQALEANTDAKSFIEPTQEEREAAVRRKIHAVHDLIAGKRVVLVEDSIVRGTTMKAVVAIAREAGATEVHVRIALDRYRFICELGVDTGNKDELVAAQMSDQEICDLIGADSIAFLPVERIETALGEKAGRFCTGCLTGIYPVSRDIPNSVPVSLTSKTPLLV